MYRYDSYCLCTDVLLRQLLPLMYRYDSYCPCMDVLVRQLLSLYGCTGTTVIVPVTTVIVPVWIDIPLRQLLSLYGCAVTTVIVPVWMYRYDSYCPWMDAPLRQLLFPYGCTVTTVIDPVWMYRYDSYCPCMDVPLRQLLTLCGCTVTAVVPVWCTITAFTVAVWKCSYNSCFSWECTVTVALSQSWHYCHSMLVMLQQLFCLLGVIFVCVFFSSFFFLYLCWWMASKFMK